MSKIHIIWLAILSVLGTLLIWFFHGTFFSSCYSAYPAFSNVYLLATAPLTNCLIYTLLITFCGLFFGPLIITLIIYSAYVLIFNRGMPNSHFILWFFWIAAIYFFAAQFSFPALI